MSQHLRTPLEIYKHLPQTNCGRCYLPSCLAFAAAVIAGTKKPADCPHLSESQQSRLTAGLQLRTRLEPNQEEFIHQLQKEVRTIDFTKTAPKIGASLQNQLLSIRSLGKEFVIDQEGRIRSECHIIPWVKIPLLSYVTNKTHQEITGTWVTFRELKDGLDLQGLFTNRIERPLQQLADKHPALLGDIIDLFMGTETEAFQADIALSLLPLPHFPLLICYQAPEEDMESKLTLFFDACCGVNLPIRSTYTLCVGLVHMFEKISLQHA